MLSISDLFTPVTEAQALETFLATLETLKIPARSWRVGGAFRSILRTVARSYAGFTDVMAAFAKSGFLDTAEGGWLRLLAYSVYGVTARPATFATGRVLFTNTGGGVYTNAAGSVIVTAIAGGVTVAYRTTEALSLLTVGATQLVAIQALEVGSASSRAPGLISTLQTQLLGVTVTNPESVVGSDAQDDESLRQTCRDKLSALSLLGSRGAYAYAVDVATRTDGSPVDINRRAIVADPLTGIVTVYVASPSGAPVADDLTAVRASVERVARPDSVTSVVVAASPVAFAKTLTVWATSTVGLSADDVGAAVIAALLLMVKAYPISGVAKAPATQGYLFATNIEGTAKAAHPAIFAIDGVGADLAINAGQVATLAATVSVRLV
jgi:hypothetical protein